MGLMTQESNGDSAVEPARISLVVAGHTNTGKTSLLRTLGRTQEFGEVSAGTATTRQIQEIRLVETTALALIAYDTPGLEAPWRVLGLVDEADVQHKGRSPLVHAIERNRGVDDGLDQEFRVLAQVLSSDAALYVIDARDDPLPKYLDELRVLAMCGRPVLPLLNFASWPQSRVSEWGKSLRDHGFHTIVEFDAVVYDWKSERSLYRALGVVLPTASEALECLIESRSGDTHWRRQAALRALADGLVDIYTCEVRVPIGDERRYGEIVEQIAGFVRAREARILKEVLACYHYTEEVMGTLPEVDPERGAWRDDPFSRETLKRWGVRARNRIALGAAGGGLCDLAVGGTTFGAGVAVGATAAAASGARGWGRRLSARYWKGEDTVRPGPTIVDVVKQRNLALIRDLERRGHASQEPITPEGGEPQELKSTGIPKALLWAEGRPEWSIYPTAESSNRDMMASGRHRTVDRLVGQLASELESLTNRRQQ